MLKQTIKHFLNVLLYSVITLLVIIAIAISLARIALPLVENYKAQIEDWLSDYTGQQVEIATLDAIWYGVEPQLVLKGVQLLSPDRMQVNGYFQDARVGLNLLASLVEWQWVPGAFTIEGARFGIVRHEDGRITIQGVASNGNTSGGSNKFLEKWIFQQRLLDVKNSEVVWTDLMQGQKPRLFQNVNLRLINKGLRHVIQGYVNLPRQFGSSINVVVDATGNLLEPNGWNGYSFVETRDLNIREFLQPLLNDRLLVRSGELNAKVWTAWNMGKVLSAKGYVEVSRMTLSSPKFAGRSGKIQQFKTKFYLRHRKKKWQLRLQDLVLTRNNKSWPSSNLQVVANPDFSAIQAQIDYLRLDDLVPLLGISDMVNDEQFKLLNKLAIQGEVKHLRFALLDSQYVATGELAAFANQPFDKLPGVSRLHGNFAISNAAASFTIPKQSVDLDYRSLFAKKIRLKALQAKVFVNWNPSGWNVSVKDIRLAYRKSRSSGSLLLVSDKISVSPLLDLAFFIQGGSLTDALYYIPVKKLSPNAITWIEQALQGGEVDQASIVHYGPIKRFPFRNHEGVFDVTLAVKEGVLRFAPDWPLITGINGTLQLHGFGMKFYASQGRSLKNALHNVVVEFSDFKAPDKRLSIRGLISGETENKLAYLHNSPLENLFANKISPLHADGKSELALKLKIPLVDVRQTQYEGKLIFLQNQLNAEEWKLQIADVNGSMTFSNAGLQSDLITGKIFATPLNISIETISDESGKHLLIKGGGVFRDEKIAEALKFYIDQGSWKYYFRGNTDLLVVVSVPLDKGDDASQAVNLQLSSNLKKLQIDLPPPFGKVIDDKREFFLSTDLSGEKRKLNIHYGDYNAVFEIVATNDTQTIEKGAIGLLQPAHLPEERGYRFVGKLPQFHWSQWQPVLFPEDEKRKLIKQAGPASSMYFDVNVQDLEVFGKRFEDVAVRASQTVQYWNIHLAADSIFGDVNIPLIKERVPLVATLDRLYITQQLESENNTAIDPKDVPELRIKIKDFHYKQASLGTVEIVTRKLVDGQLFDKLSVVSDAVHIDGKGQWKKPVNEKERSELKFDASAKNFGEALENWGYKNVLKGGKGELRGKVYWPGSPADFALKDISGELVIDLKDASILDFDIGAARLFSILLPRRLLLDFRDVIQEGMYFDTINGKYTLQNGKAYTNGLDLKGPVADINLAGKIDLGTKTFDQVVTINRRILGDSLPLVGSVLSTLNPIAVGGGLFVMKKLFEKQINDILSVQYTLEGKWGSPVIKEVDKPEVTDEGDGDTLIE